MVAFTDIASSPCWKDYCLKGSTSYWFTFKLTISSKLFIVVMMMSTSEKDFCDIWKKMTVVRLHDDSSIVVNADTRKIVVTPI